MLASGKNDLTEECELKASIKNNKISLDFMKTAGICLIGSVPGIVLAYIYPRVGNVHEAANIASAGKNHDYASMALYYGMIAIEILIPLFYLYIAIDFGMKFVAKRKTGSSKTRATSNISDDDFLVLTSAKKFNSAEALKQPSDQIEQENKPQSPSAD